jgi:hypothetical protein
MILGRDFATPENEVLHSAVVSTPKFVKGNEISPILDPLELLLMFHDTETPAPHSSNPLDIVDPSQLSIKKGLEGEWLDRLNSTVEQNKDLSLYMDILTTAPVEDTSFDRQPIEFELCRDFNDYISQSATPNPFDFDMSIFSSPPESKPLVDEGMM